MPMKALYFDNELYDKLKTEKNASGLIQGLYRDYLDKVEFIGLTEEELALERKKEEILIEARKKIEELTNGKD